MAHRLAAPLAVNLATPDQCRRNHVVSVAIDVGPNLHALADDTFDRETAAINRGVNIFDLESATRALDSLAGFVHSDAAIEFEMMSRSQKGCVTGYYNKLLTTHWFRKEL